MASNEKIVKYLLEMEDRITKELARTAVAAKDADKKILGLQKQLKETSKKGTKATSSLKKGLQGLKGPALAAVAGVTALAGAFGALGVSSIRTSANLENFEVRLGGLLGGLDRGQQRVKELFELSARTPFQIQGLVEAEATLEAFGVNAPRVRQGVMDLAGAFGMDLTAAAGAVGKALAGGAAGAMQLKRKGVLAMVEMTAGVKTANMSLGEFQEALVKTLDTNKKLAGGTERLAQTYKGLMSTLKDQFTVFAKQVGDAKLFATAKASLIVMLEMLGENKKETASFAQIVGSNLAQAWLVALETVAEIAIAVGRMRMAWAGVGQAILHIRIELAQANLAIYEMLSALGDTSASVRQYSSLVTELQGRFSETADEMYGLWQTENALVQKSGELVGRVTELRDKMLEASAAAKGVKIPPATDPDAIMTMVGLDPAAAGKAEKAAKDADKATKEAAKALKKYTTELRSTRKGFADLAKSTRKPVKESEKLAKAYDQMVKKLSDAAVKAIELGDDGRAAFVKVKDGMVASMAEIEAAIPKAKGAERAAAVGAGMEGAADFASTGGMGMLGAAGPVGAGAAAMIGVGGMGEDAYQEEVQRKAQASAAKRQEQMQSEAEEMKEKGYSEEEIEAAGLGQEAIAEAGEVTKEDKAQAEAATERGEETANAIKEIIEGVFDAAMNILMSLPDILMMVAQDLLVKLPLALIEMLPAMIEQLIPVLITDLPIAIIKAVGKVIPKLIVSLVTKIIPAIFIGVGTAIAKWWRTVWNAIRDFFSLGFQTGGYVPKTSSYLLHQGERVVPASGAGSGTASKGLAAFNAGGSSLTVNTNVVDPDAIHGLSRLIDAEVGAHGRTTVPIWGASSPVTSI